MHVCSSSSRRCVLWLPATLAAVLLIVFPHSAPRSVGAEPLSSAPAGAAAPHRSTPAGDQFPPAALDHPETPTGDELVHQYLRLETARISQGTLADIDSGDDWRGVQAERRRQLQEMLGLDPWPERTPLVPVVTGTLDHPEFTVEKLHFQSLPHLYVTASLYLPKGLSGPAPAVLYGCGHAQVKRDGVSYGNKVAYQHHGIWFARHGFVCLVIDSLQRGEIEGEHHGTYSQNMWWWIARGYTPAGLEAWNCIRALDYLQSRPEVDPDRLGITGISGGGVYSWWTAALDERLRAVVPVAGITSLHNHVVDGCVEGHCDCMYMVNTYEWDFPLVAALVAPRPLLISNADADPIFPLEGVIHVHAGARRIYRLLGAGDQIGLQLTYGGHQDSQELQIHAFVWMNRHLRQVDEPIELPAAPLFEPQDLRVFTTLPADEINTRIEESFVPLAAPPIPRDAAHWAQLRDGWLQALREQCFRSWPDFAGAIAAPRLVHAGTQTDLAGLAVELQLLESQPPYSLPMEFLSGAAGSDQPTRIELHVLDQPDWEARHERAPLSGARLVRLAPRGVGPTEWSREERARTQIRRRFMILGQTDDSGRVWDVRRALQALRAQDAARPPEIVIHARGAAAVWALYASLFEPPPARLELVDLPATHADGPVFLNVLKHLDIAQAIALAAERGPVSVSGAGADELLTYARRTAATLGGSGLSTPTDHPR